jgi:type I restriction enzyme R subunit
VLDRAVTLKNMLKNPRRVDLVARFVASHYGDYVKPMGYKALLVAVDREACGLYKEALDRYLPPEYSEVGISRGANDPEHVRRYHLSDEEEAAIRKAFRKPDENPQILIVTEKLLTGYDAPILYCMYLDKPMRDHVLLQAIARVNRPYEDEEGRRKRNGLIVDFVGIFDHLERALAYDSRDVEGVVEGLDVLKERFAALMEQGRREFLTLSSGKSGDKAVDAVLEHFRDKDRRQAFYAYFRELEEVYEILSPDPFLRPFLEDYHALVEMYRLLRGYYEPHVQVEKSFLRKTAQIVQEHTTTGAVHEPKVTYEIGADALRTVLAKQAPDTVKVFNLLKTLHDLVEAKGNDQPYLIPIGERAEAIRRAFEERQIESQQALQELAALIRDLQKAEEQRRVSTLSRETFAVAWWLRVQKGCEADQAERLAASLEQAFKDFPHWGWSQGQERELRQLIYKEFLKAGVKDKDIVSWTDEMLNLLRRAMS